MLSLIYVSTAATQMNDAEIEAITTRAAARNANAGVTGMLAYNSRNFMQLLEGGGEAVLSIMQDIERDERHESIVYLRQDSRESRECPDWSMRSLLTPLVGIGSASVFTGSLPRTMELDTKMLFTSFASSLTADAAQRHAEQEAALMAGTGAAQND
ncbi:BLUF domain-containing protein [uncultured Erythrobacter sp.]|uniref:BLUF domain-containing protein n=1 Tax=uncultured Erythrobacter sp. TaxID=263913 RepID=UPI002614FE22|nr:BLUF domain-containing protein [uncultured Erythrobacter sp.]